jgi:hypothetical protein
MKDCTFSGMGDDGINVTGLYQAVEFGGTPRRLTLSGGRYAPTPLWAAPRARDRLLLVSALTLEPLAEVEVASIDTQGISSWAVELTANLPNLGIGSVFGIDLQKRVKLLISGCRFLGNRARGILAHGDAIIEKCYFEHQSESAVLLAPDMFWQEGPAVERTIVRDSNFSAVNILEHSAGVIWIGAFITTGGRQGLPSPAIVNDNVAVEDNVFTRPNAPAVAAAATKNLRIEKNRIDGAGAVAFAFENVRAVKASGNICAPEAVIVVDRFSRGALDLKGNTGLRIL